ncbi:MAG: hypothetical protein K2Q26_03965 [Bdellovibrionales bacterium]|nr:hypothetical protein [Bdellovibrionales bacterium]
MSEPVVSEKKDVESSKGTEPEKKNETQNPIVGFLTLSAVIFAVYTMYKSVSYLIWPNSQSAFNITSGPRPEDFSEQLIKEVLKDPVSATFSNVKVVDKKKTEKGEKFLVVSTVRAANSFGGFLVNDWCAVFEYETKSDSYFSKPDVSVQQCSRDHYQYEIVKLSNGW